MPEILPHKTAIRRKGLSKPAQLALEHGILDKSRILFDYGSGFGKDLVLLRKRGIQCTGWDPVWAPEADFDIANIVMLNYVLCVIPDRKERRFVLKHAWNLCTEALIVAVRHSGERKYGRPYKDGYVTSRKTFQKYYSADQIKRLIKKATGQRAEKLDAGIFAVRR